MKLMKDCFWLTIANVDFKAYFISESILGRHYTAFLSFIFTLLVSRSSLEIPFHPVQPSPLFFNQLITRVKLMLITYYLDEISRVGFSFRQVVFLTSRKSFLPNTKTFQIKVQLEIFRSVMVFTCQ